MLNNKTDPSEFPKANAVASLDMDIADTGWSEHTVRSKHSNWFFVSSKAHLDRKALPRFPEATVYTTFPSKSPNAHPRTTINFCGFFGGGPRGSVTVHFNTPMHSSLFQTRAVPSFELETIISFSLGANATAHTALICPTSGPSSQTYDGSSFTL